MWEKIASEEERQFYRTLDEKVKAGDYINACIPNQYPKDLKTFKGFMFMFDKLAKDKELGLYDIRILSYFIANVGFENYVNIPQQKVADDLDIKQPDVSKSLKKLQNKNIITKEKVGRNNFYRVNPELIWRGKTAEWKKVVDINEIRKKQEEQYNGKLPF